MSPGVHFRASSIGTRGVDRGRDGKVTQTWPTGNQELSIEHSALGRVGGNSKLKTENSKLMCVRGRPAIEN